MKALTTGVKKFISLIILWPSRKFNNIFCGYCIGSRDITKETRKVMVNWLDVLTLTTESFSQAKGKVIKKYISFEGQFLSVKTV